LGVPVAFASGEALVAAPAEAFEVPVDQIEVEVNDEFDQITVWPVEVDDAR
jgi:hypothetical protein